MDESLNAIALSDQRFVMGIIACEVRQDAGRTGEHIDVIWTEQANQLLQQAVHTLLKERKKDRYSPLVTGGWKYSKKNVRKKKK